MTIDGPVATLAGVLSGFALADVLQLLELGARSGELVVDGGPPNRGAIQLRAGRVVGVTDAARAPVAADAQIATITRMLDWTAGRWAFHAASESFVTVDADAGVAITTILVEAARWRDEHARCGRDAAPARVDVPELADGEEQAESAACARLTAGDLQVLAAVDGARDVSELATLTRRDVSQVVRALDRLRALGVVRASPTPRRAHVT